MKKVNPHEAALVLSGALYFHAKIQMSMDQILG